MKMSKKGQNKIGEFLCGFQRRLAGARATALAPLEFEPDDFEGVVVLTVEEAKTIEFCLAIFQKHYKLFESEMKVWQELRKRIDQAEMSKQSISEGRHVEE